ncbi:hypothetical protein BELL_0692g00010 [Botrytis elliptica]|uniref:Uncharacterized protein n=1 Tax=Botrytis elliptica TaxID=278938 RepID=A0A4Z1JBL9_9HELO|nr:hypothetical protein BELL_0692g00010 [Botrytis elliptica]
MASRKPGAGAGEEVFEGEIAVIDGKKTGEKVVGLEPRQRLHTILAKRGTGRPAQSAAAIALLDRGQKMLCAKQENRRSVLDGGAPTSFSQYQHMCDLHSSASIQVPKFLPKSQKRVQDQIDN